MVTKTSPVSSSQIALASTRDIPIHFAKAMTSVFIVARGKKSG